MRLIDADELYLGKFVEPRTEWNQGWNDALDAATTQAPAVDAVPVVHGRWLHTEEPLGWREVECIECSACHDSWIIPEDYGFDDLAVWNYCPNCGAKMDGGKDDEKV